MENNNSLKTDTADTAATSDSNADQLKTWHCILCGFVYDEAAGIPEEGIPAGTRWADVPQDWICPECSAPKADFEMIEI